ncbi:MAG: hypothetical protein ACLFVO_20510 [Chloroflexaceae bacterium]
MRFWTFVIARENLMVSTTFQQIGARCHYDAKWWLWRYVAMNRDTPHAGLGLSRQICYLKKLPWSKERREV